MKKITTLEQSLGILSSHQEDLLDNARIMGLNADNEWDNLNSLQIKKRMAKAILDNPLPLLKQLPIEDFIILQKLANAEPNICIETRTTQQILPIVMLGLAQQYSCKDNDEYDYFNITEDFKKAIRPFIDGILDDSEVKLRLLVEEHLIGSLNIYGLLTKDELKTILKKCLLQVDDGSGLFDHIYPNSIALKSLIVENYHFHSLFLSPYVSFYGDIIEARKKRKDITSLKSFSPDIIRKAGQMPFPELPNPVNNKILYVLHNKLGYSETDAYYLRIQIWRMAQIEDVSDIIKDVIGNAPAAKNIEELNDALAVLSDYINNSPRWNFRGYSPADIHIQPKSAPAISLGPNMRAMGYEQADVQNVVTGMWNSPKVGRNDPCPCGSGKKYKHCCGKKY